MVNLSVDFCGVRFLNPFVLAAAPTTDSAEMVARGFENGWAGAVLKTTSTVETEVSIAYPIMSSLNREGKMIGLHNIDLISERHIDQVAEDVRQLKRAYPRHAVIGSIVGNTREEWQFLAQKMAEAGADLIECSLSCPQGSMLEDETNPLGSMVSQDPRLTKKVAEWIKEAVPNTPVYIKLTSGVTDLVGIVRAVKASGADGICLIDSVEGILGVDLETLEPLPSVQGYSSHGGYSGRAIKPIALRCVADAAKACELPIAGVGGIYDWRDALEFLLLGATTVQVCTAVMELGFGIASEMADGLQHWLSRKGFSWSIMKACPTISRCEPGLTGIFAFSAGAVTCPVVTGATRRSYGTTPANLTWMWKNASAVVSAHKFARYLAVSQSSNFEIQSKKLKQ